MKISVSLCCLSLCINAHAVSPVSVVDLLINGEVYEGKSVQVFGYLDGTAGSRLYLTDNHARGRDLASSIFLSILGNQAGDVATCENKYVYLQGTVGKTGEGIVLIKNITKMTSAYEVQDCYKEGDGKLPSGLFGR